jgi:hypothetical protein
MKKIKQKELSELGFGSSGTINNIFKGRQLPTVKFVESFLEFVPDVDAKWLITGRKTDHTKLKIEGSNIDNNIVGNVTNSEISSNKIGVNESLEISKIKVEALKKEVKDKEQIIELLKEQISILQGK